MSNPGNAARWQVWLECNWLTCTPAQAMRWLRDGHHVRITTAPESWPACEFCGQKVEPGNVDRFGRVWCGCSINPAMPEGAGRGHRRCERERATGEGEGRV